MVSQEVRRRLPLKGWLLRVPKKGAHSAIQGIESNLITPNLQFPVDTSIHHLLQLFGKWSKLSAEIHRMVALYQHTIIVIPFSEEMCIEDVYEHL